MESDKAAVDDLRRFTLFGATAENPSDGEPLGVGVEFPDGTVAVDLHDVQAPPGTYHSLGELGELASKSVADGPENDTWVDWADGENGGDA